LAEDPTYYPARQVDVHPQALQKIEPAYPDRAADMAIEGEVTLLLLVDEYGVVREASVVDAKPEGWFEDSTLAAFKKARFRPAERKGRAVKSRVLIRVTYELNGGRPGAPKTVR
ncbi:MAG: energy transducer TonB, partial [Sulfuricellaceae bacterium]